jgi:hypothetical protein
MRLHLLFPTVKTAALYLASIKSYSKNTHAPFILKWAIENLNSLTVIFPERKSIFFSNNS